MKRKAKSITRGAKFAKLDMPLQDWIEDRYPLTDPQGAILYFFSGLDDEWRAAWATYRPGKPFHHPYAWWTAREKESAKDS